MKSNSIITFCIFLLSINPLYAEINIKYARCFSVEQDRDIYNVSIKNPSGTNYYYEIPNTKEKKTFALRYVSEVAFLTELEHIDDIIAMHSPQYIYDQQIHYFLGGGTVVAFNEDTVPIEKLLSLSPSYYSMDVFQKRTNAVTILSIQKTLVIHPIYFLEKTPLGKAEWVKFYGILTGETEKANKLFDLIEDKYLELTDKASETTSSPKVILELPYQDTWFVASPNSLMAQYLKDANADYLITGSHGQKIASLALTQEDLIKYLSQTEIWIISSNESLTKKTLYERYPYLKPIKDIVDKVRIYSSSKKIRQQSNDIFESGDVHVERVLQDILIMTHPKLLPSKDLYYYEEVL